MIYHVVDLWPSILNKFLKKDNLIFKKQCQLPITYIIINN